MIYNRTWPNRRSLACVIEFAASVATQVAVGTVQRRHLRSPLETHRSNVQ